MEVKTRVSYSRTWEEYRVELYVDGMRDESATYFTDDIEDARYTAKEMEALAFAKALASKRS